MFLLRPGHGKVAIDLLWIAYVIFMVGCFLAKARGKRV
jgi:hypothetical protein